MAEVVFVEPRSASRGRGLCSWMPAGPPRESALKRPLDVALSSVGLLLGAPIFAVVALAIKLEDRGPIFYAQQRVGLGQRGYPLRKFRSMVPDAEARTGPVQSVENDPRVTRVGRLLRRTACDELPQLLSILNGDMSFVGPRSVRRVFSDRFAAELPAYARRYEVRPGLTGLAQVFARYDSPPHQKLRFDLLYLRRASLALDLKLIAASFLVTFLGRWDERRGKKLRHLRQFIALGGRRRRRTRPSART